MSSPRWQFWIDRGGTFTDVVARTPDGAIVTAKMLSEDPARYADAAVAAIRRLTGFADGPLPPADIRIGTTVATNALLERRGEPVLLVVTRGFADAVMIGHQARPDIFACEIVRPAPLYARVVEVDERVTAEGEVLVALDHEAARAVLQEAYDDGLRAVAIALVHGYRHRAHEAALAGIARAVGFAQVSVSHEVSPLIRLIPRASTTVADAYLSPVLAHYVAGLSAALGGERRIAENAEADLLPLPAPRGEGEVLFMQSSGGLVDGSAFRGKDALLSGPAGGIVGMARTAAAAGFARVIGFDMGGTSTDVSLHDGRFERRNDMEIGGVHITAATLRIDTVAAGGGSLCRWAGGRLVVGPESAGAVPGPACYRRGGPLTVTDCNLLLGKLVADHFPRVFGANGDQALDRDAAAARMDELLDTMAADARERPDPLAVAQALVATAVANMANAVKAISVARGHDPVGYALSCFGGAGGQHACLVADSLRIERVIVHPLAGLLSAYGMGLADRRAVREETVAVALTDENALAGAVRRLESEARDALVSQGVAVETIRAEATARIRFASGDTLIEVPVGSPEAMRAAFEAGHVERFGFVGEGALLVEQLGVEAIADAAAEVAAFPLPPTTAPPLASVRAYLAGKMRATPLHDRAGLAAGARVVGPALIVDPASTTVVEPGWTAEVDRLGNLILSRHAARAVAVAGTDADPLRLEIFAGLFMALAKEMGAALQRSAASVNIRERLDFSCALFDARGSLVANAPHIPVHLGSMGDSIRTVIERRSADGRGMLPGDAYALNAPYAGGTHLPDITVVMPVFVPQRIAGRPAFYVAARGHHADVGGIAPGSMPPDSRTIADEGVVLDNVLLAGQGRFREAAMRDLLASGPHPARNIDQNIADLMAQVAACHRGADGLTRMCAEQGLATVSAYMEHVQAHAAASVRAALATLPDGAFAYELDNGAVVRVAVRVDREGRTAIVDFAGTSDQRSDNFNAPRSVVRAAVLYVLRLMVGEAIPLNDGFLRPVTIVIPEASMLSPRFPAAVVAGNVETSQVVTDALLGALGVMAGSQGTMNNFTFGDDTRQYYETICGGAGAGPGFDGAGFDGASAVQTHMTNSRLTDPEVLETRFPVLVEAFGVRRGSGGVGERRGGDGVTRRLRFREPMRAAILSNRRRIPPFGLAGGGAGAAGANRVERADGRVDVLGSTAQVEMRPGDVIVIDTPGGGGWGAA